MIPKKPQVIIKQVAEELDLPQTLVDDIVSFYYKEVRRNLSSLEHININLAGLGHFIIKQKAVNMMIKKHESAKKNYNRDTFKNYHNLKLVEQRLDKLYNAKKDIVEYLEEKKKFKDGRKTERSLEEPEADNGGN
jgi:nucleoid DNA-binding protein